MEISLKPFKRIIKGVRLDNAEQSAIHEIGIDDVDMNIDEKSIDWDDELPSLIKPTIKNFRLCYEKSETVKGIIEDLVIKSISGWVLEGNNQEAIDYIENYTWSTTRLGLDRTRELLDKLGNHR